MVEFEVDVSGEDLLSKNYTICIANKDSIIRGFKFNEELISILSSRYGQGKYKYAKSKKGKSDLKVRIYSAVIYYLFKSLDIPKEMSLIICRDFPGKEGEIRNNFNLFLEKELGFTIKNIHFSKLSPESNAHKYAYMMRIDTKNMMKTYVKISLEDLEKWIIKR